MIIYKTEVCLDVLFSTILSIIFQLLFKKRTRSNKAKANKISQSHSNLFDPHAYINMGNIRCFESFDSYRRAFLFPCLCHPDSSSNSDSSHAFCFSNRPMLY